MVILLTCLEITLPTWKVVFRFFSLIVIFLGTAFFCVCFTWLVHLHFVRGCIFVAHDKKLPGSLQNALEVSNNYGRKLHARYDNLTDTTRVVCTQNSEFLVLPAQQFKDWNLSCSLREDFALAIMQLLHRKWPRSSFSRRYNNMNLKYATSCSKIT